MSNDIDDLYQNVERVDRILEYLLAKHGEQLCPKCNGLGGLREPYYENTTTFTPCVACRENDTTWHPGSGVTKKEAKP